MQKYAEKEGIEVVRLLEFQETGDRKLRKNFDEMVEFVIANPDITDIVSFRVDRLTRNFRDHVKMDDLRLDHDKVLHFVDDQIVIRKKSHGKPIEDWDTKAYLAKQHLVDLRTH